MACYQASEELGDELIISIRCFGAGKHLQHAGPGSLGTRIEEHWSIGLLKSRHVTGVNHKIHDG